MTLYGTAIIIIGLITLATFSTAQEGGEEPIPTPGPTPTTTPTPTPDTRTRLEHLITFDTDISSRLTVRQINDIVNELEELRAGVQIEGIHETLKILNYSYTDGNGLLFNYHKVIE